MKEKEIERLTQLKEIEKELYGKGFKKICGIDEAGRGSLAGRCDYARKFYDRRSK